MDGTTVAAAIAGGLLIGVAAATLLYYNGRIAGISNILAGVLRRSPGDLAWRLAFLGGLIAGGGVLLSGYPPAFELTYTPPWPFLALAGLLVGYGVGMANGCTSGHGVCGIARLSRRSIVATLTFMGSAMATVYLTHHLVPEGILS